MIVNRDYVMETLRTLIGRFRDSESGSATIEAVLWFPMFVVLLVMVTDVSFVFHRQSQLYRIVQDANRSLSTGRFSTTAATESYIENLFRNVSQNVNATTTVSSRVISTSVVVPVEDLVAIGYFNFLDGYNITVQSDQFQEY